MTRRRLGTIVEKKIAFRRILDTEEYFSDYRHQLKVFIQNRLAFLVRRKLAKKQKLIYEAQLKAERDKDFLAQQAVRCGKIANWLRKKNVLQDYNKMIEKKK